MEFSVVVVTWKGDDLLADCLDSLARVYGTGPEVFRHALRAQPWRYYLNLLRRG